MVRNWLSAALVGSVLFGLSTVLATADTEQWSPPGPGEYSTPPGITLIDVMHLKGEWTYQWTRLGDADGNTLYISEHDTEVGKSFCRAECAQTFPPVLALPDAKAQGDWSLVPREEGRLQWAYRGKPLYRFARESHIHEVVNNVLNRDLAENTIISKAHVDKDALLPPEGWHIARFNPVADMPMPMAISAANIPWANGYGLVSSDGMTLYTQERGTSGFDSICDGNNCGLGWLPFEAPALATAVGDFVPVSRPTGLRQWAFRGALLFTFGGDADPGDIRGLEQAAEDSEPGWQLALLKRHYMPSGIALRNQAVFGKALFSAAGKPLYSRNPLEIQRFYHRNVVYQKGKLLGNKGCDAQCEQQWPPFLAPDDAVACGYWEILRRADGRRQWMYKGHALYTYENDDDSGVANGNNIYDYVIGDGRYKIADVAENHRGIPIGAALHWLAVVP